MPIFVDSRGKGEKELAEALKGKGLPVEVKALGSGDVVIMGTDLSIGIERKTVNDLYFSVVGSKKSWSKSNRHFWQQMETLKNTYNRPVLIVEGSIPKEYSKVCNGVARGVMVGWGIPILTTRNFEGTIKVVTDLFYSYGAKKVKQEPPATVRKSRSIKEIKLAMLQCVEGIGPYTAKMLLRKEPLIISTVLGYDYLKKTLESLPEFTGTKRKIVIRETLLKLLYGEDD